MRKAAVRAISLNKRRRSNGCSPTLGCARGQKHISDVSAHSLRGEKIFIPNARNPLKSRNSDEIIQGNPTLVKRGSWRRNGEETRKPKSNGRASARRLWKSRTGSVQCKAAWFLDAPANLPCPSLMLQKSTHAMCGSGVCRRPTFDIKTIFATRRFCQRPHRKLGVSTDASHSGASSSSSMEMVTEQPAISSDVT